MEDAAQLLEAWCERYEKISLVNQSLLKRLPLLFEAFEQKGIEVIPLKGLDLLLRAYSGYGRRSLGDVDLLVQEKDVEKICEILLKEQGFFRRPSRDRFWRESFADESLDFISSEFGFDLDLSWNALFFHSIQFLWERRVVRPTCLGPRKLLHPEDALLYHVAYAVTIRRRFLPYFVQDLRVFLEKEGNRIDWQAWSRRVETMGLKVPVYHGLSYARAQGLQIFPEKILTLLRLRSPGEQALALFYRRTVSEQSASSKSTFFLFLGIPGWRRKARFLGRALFPSSRFIEFRRGKVSWARRIGVGILRPFRILIRSLYFLPRDLKALLGG